MIVRSVNKDECEAVPGTVVVIETELPASSSSAVNVGVSITTSSAAVIVPSDNHESTSSLADFEPRSMSQMCELQAVTRPSVSSEVLPKSAETCSPPGGLVAFCQSDTSAFTSVMTKKPLSLAVEVPGCDRRLRDACTARNSQSFKSIRAASFCANCCRKPVVNNGRSVPYCDDPSASGSSQVSDSESNSVEPSQGSDEPAQSFTESPVSVSDVASFHDQNSWSLSPVHKTLPEDELNACNHVAYQRDGYNEGVMSHYPCCIQVPMSAIPPRPPCYCSPMARMNYRYPTPMPTYMQPICGSEASNYDNGFAQLSYGGDELVQSFIGNPASNFDVASSFEQTSSAFSEMDETFPEDQFAVFDNSVYNTNGYSEGFMTRYPSYIPAPVPCLRPRPPFYHVPYPYPRPGPPYMTPMMSCYSPPMSAVQPGPYPAYPVVPPQGVMPPVGVVPMAYPPFPAHAPCFIPSSAMCHPQLMPPSKPMLPTLPP